MVFFSEEARFVGRDAINQPLQFMALRVVSLYKVIVLLVGIQLQLSQTLTKSCLDEFSFVLIQRDSRGAIHQVPKQSERTGVQRNLFRCVRYCWYGLESYSHFPAISRLGS